MIEMLDAFVPLVGTADETDAIEYLYRVLDPVNFSRDILECSTERVAAMELTGVESRRRSRRAGVAISQSYQPSRGRTTPCAIATACGKARP